MAPVVEVEPTVQALLAYLRERDQQRDREVAELRAELAQARADLVDHVAQLAETREQLRALQAPQPAATPAPLTEDERQELVTPRAEHELHLSRWDKQPAPAAPPRSWWRRLLG